MTVVACPTCGKQVQWTEANKYRPFCSERCKKIDLGAWAEEKFVIPGAASADSPANPPDEPQDER